MTDPSLPEARLPAGYGIRPTATEDLVHLPAIERDGAELFRTVGWGPAYERIVRKSGPACSAERCAH